MSSQRKVLDIRGRRFGGGTPLICSSLVGRSAERIANEARSTLAKGADVLEWRVDFFDGIGDTEAVLATARGLRAAIGDTPLIFTRRGTREAGQPIALGEDAVLRLYDAVAAAGVIDFLEYEMDSAPARVRQARNIASAHGVQLILSYHDFDATPGLDELVERFEQAELQMADVAKIAVMPRVRDDVLNLLIATARADARLGIPVISMSMGAQGVVTRMMGDAFGSAMTFAVGETRSAPGQLPIADLRAVFDVLQRAKGG
ncbi:MAG: type I 3-dehydroquinate dehydratase [Betaproteobacteria bacterium]|nr:type I 3-dehydroquinate dehydratase [Betaproteobacteria bacterium]